MTNFDPKDHFDLESLPEWARGLITRQHAEIEGLREEVRRAHGSVEEAVSGNGILVGYGSEEDGAMPRVFLPPREPVLFQDRRKDSLPRCITVRWLEAKKGDETVSRWLQLESRGSIVVVPQRHDAIAIRFQGDG